jgi:hypothetical protein
LRFPSQQYIEFLTLFLFAMKTKLILFLALLVGFCNCMDAQSISLQWSGQQSPFTSCIDQAELTIDISNPLPGDLMNASVLVDFDEMFDVPPVVTSSCGTAALNNNPDGSVTVVVNSADNICSLSLFMEPTCSTDGVNTYSGQVNASLLINQSPAASDFEPFVINEATITIIGPATQQGQHFVGEDVFLTYEVKAGNAPIENVLFEIISENEVNASGIEVDITYPSAITLSYILSGNQLYINIPQENNGLPLAPLEQLDIVVKYPIAYCSSVTSETLFLAFINCNNEPCNGATAPTNFDVEPANQWFTPQVHWWPGDGIGNDFLSNSPVLTCEPFDITYTLAGRNVPAGFPDEAGIYDFHEVVIHVNTTFYTLGTNLLINGVPYPLVGSPFINVSGPPTNTAITITLDPVGGYPTNWPLMEGNTPGHFNGLWPGPSNFIAFTFDDVQLNCAALSGNCLQGVDFFGGYTTQELNWSNMCEGPLDSPGYAHLDNHHTDYSFIESSATDLDNGGINTAQITYNYHPNQIGAQNPGTQPWIIPYNNVAGPMYDCDATEVNLVVTLDNWLSLGSNTITVDGIPLTFSYSPTQGAPETVIIPLGSLLPVGPIVLDIINDDCIEGSFGTQGVALHLESHCVNDECNSNCPMRFGCQSYSFFVHCTGDCIPGHPLETYNHGFLMRRSTYGLTTGGAAVADRDIPTALANGFNLARAYPCDELEIEAHGFSNDYYAGNSLTEAYFELRQTPGAVSLNNLDPSGFSGTFHFVAPPGTPSISDITIGPAEYEVLTVGGDDVVRLHIPSSSIPASLLNFKYDIDFIGHVLVEDNLPALGFFDLFQIRGQFGCLYNSVHQGSCDSWGADLTLLESEGFVAINSWDQIGNGFTDADWGSDCNNCLRKLVLETRNRGGFPLADDFPNELRPVLEWPNDIALSNISGLTFDQAYFWAEENESYTAQTFSQLFPVASVNQGNNVHLVGIGSNNSSDSPCSLNTLGGVVAETPENLVNANWSLNWVMMDKDGLNRQSVIMTFKEDCAIASTPGEVTVDAVFKNLPCQTDLIHHADIEDVGPTNDNYQMSIVGGVWNMNVFSNPVQIQTTLEYAFQDAPPLPNSFIYIPGGLVNSITITPTTGQCAATVSSLGNGLWMIGNICGDGLDYQVNFDITYTCTESSDPGFDYEPINFPVYFGFDCNTFISDVSTLIDGDPSNDPCFLGLETITINPQPSGLAVEPSLPSPLAVNACELFSFDFILSSTEEADVQNLLASLATDGLTITAASYEYPLGTTPIALAGPFVDPYIVDFNALIGLFPGNHSTAVNPEIVLHFEAIASCSAEEYALILNVTGNAACGDPLSVVLPYSIDVTTPDPLTIDVSVPPILNCGDHNVTVDVGNIPAGASSLELSITLPTQVVLSGANPPVTQTIPGSGTITYVWTIVAPSQNTPINFIINIPTGFSQNFQLLADAYAADANGCSNLCSSNEIIDLFGECLPCSAEFTSICKGGLCYEFSDPDTDDPCPGEYWTIQGLATFYADDAITFCFPSPGIYYVCHYECCGIDGSGEPIMINSCRTVLVENCCCLPTDFAAVPNGCSVCLDLSGNCSPHNAYSINWGDGSADNNLCHNYANSGVYVITLLDNCSSSEPSVIAVHEVYVNCECEHPCSITARWSFKEEEDCRFSLIDASVAGPGTTIIGWTWLLDGVAFASTPNTAVVLPPGLHNICLKVDAVNDRGEECSDIYCLDLECCGTSIEGCGGNINASGVEVGGCLYSFIANANPNSGSSVVSWLWDFGDGQSSTLQNPVHQYGGPGTYTVSLEVTFVYNDEICIERLTLFVEVRCEESCDIIAELSMEAINCTIYGYGAFSNYNGRCNVNYLWEFGDGSFSTSQNPVHSYALSGSYTVCLTTWVNCGDLVCSDRICKDIDVECNCLCEGTPQFSVVQTAPCEVQLTYNNNLPPCLNIHTMVWYMGDGNYVLGNPTATYTYSSPGDYQVCCSAVAQVNGQDCEREGCINIHLNCLPFMPEWPGDGNDPGSLDLDKGEFKIMAAPNPNNGQFVIYFSENVSAGELILRDDVGRIVSRETMQGDVSSYTWNTGSLACGMYSVEFNGANKRSQTRVVICE